MGTPRVVRVAGALAEVAPFPGARLYELVRIGEARLLGEVVRVTGSRATVQVLEETTGLRVGTAVRGTGAPLSVELGPGLLGTILDGVGRPLESLAATDGSFLEPGGELRALDPDRVWDFLPGSAPGDEVVGGDPLGTVKEAPDRPHRILVPPGVAGTVAEIRSGSFRIDEPVGRLEDGTPLHLAHSWPVRTPRPVRERLASDRPLVTGQRILDFLFPVAEGGTVAVPGGFGTGKTVIEQSLARHADADVVVFIGCGERGNEMAEVVEEFPELQDPRTGRALMERTVLVVNTSNMPVAARESSIYLGLTVAEYFRDMGRRVAVLADSLSRWAEALREIAGRLQELPGEEGYPTYLGNRLGKLFERAGRARARGEEDRVGAVTFIAAVSPPGGDFSEPVTQACLRVAGGLWALDAELAHQRQFPAVDWSASYSLYVERAGAWFADRVDPGWSERRRRVLELLQEARELRDIAELVGPEAMDDRDRLTLATGEMARELLLAQNAFDPGDAFSPPARTAALSRLLLELLDRGREILAGDASLADLDLRPVREAMAELRRADPEALEELTEAAQAAVDELAGGARSGGPADGRHGVGTRRMAERASQETAEAGP